MYLCTHAPITRHSNDVLVALLHVILGTIQKISFLVTSYGGVCLKAHCIDIRNNSGVRMFEGVPLQRVWPTRVVILVNYLGLVGVR